MLASAVLLLIGAQLAFLVKLPQLSMLLRDPHAMWLVFSTWPEMRFGLFCFLVIPTYQIISGMSRKGLKPLGVLRAIRGMNRPVIVAVIGISVFLLPLVLAMPFVFLELVALLFCAVLGCLFFIWASQAGMPLLALWMIAALALGFFGNLLMSDADHRPFTCRSGAVQLQSGESVPCGNLVWLSGKPLWLIEGPQRPRLILRRDIDDDQVDQASVL
ncbi:hypothetical protein ABFT80_03590 [Mesorhizobium sp. SB112]|uniref:hypothetical protein n=1 Tax=Mesorhizobium sp. SB112 TaxID=3151853 RepID=UPI003264A827